MSASREKNKRKEQSANSAAVSKEKAGMSKGLKGTLITIAIIVFVALVVFFTMLNGGFFANHTTAAVVGSHKLSPAMVNYFYYDAYNSFQQQYSSLYTYMLDTEKPLSEQECTMGDAEEGESWADYFMRQGLEQAKKTYTMYDNAIAAGETLSEEEQENIDSYIGSFGTYAMLQGLSSADAYVSASFGKGCNTKNFREYLELTEIANHYTTEYADSLTFTQEEKDAEYQKNASDYDTVDYRSYYFAFTDYLKDGEEEATDEEKAQAKADAEAMAAAVTDEESFIALAKENAPESAKEEYEDESFTLRTEVSSDAAEEVASEWLFDTARQEGDVETFENDYGVYVIYYLGRGHNEYKLVNVRHILIGVDDTTDTEAMESAKQQAEEILQQYKDGEQTEEAFAELAKENSTDSNAEDGGLYENVRKGQMVTEFNDWIFDESRKTGDVDIVLTQYGYHIIYFVGQAEQTYQDYLITQALKNNAYDAWEAEKLEGVTYSFFPDMMKYTTAK